MTNTIWRAAGVLAIREDGKALGFRRDDDPNGVSLPCGGIEVNESPLDAARRELREETGYVVAETHAAQHYCAVDDVDNSEVHVFMIRLSSDHAQVEPGTPDEGAAEWVDAGALLTSKYADFNRKMLAHFGML